MQLPNLSMGSSSNRQRQPKYRVPGTVPVLPGAMQGLNAGTGSIGSNGLVGGVGLQGVPSPIPEIAQPDRTHIDPGLVSAPVYNLAQVDAARSKSQAQQPLLKLEAYKELSKLAPMGNASPDVAGELGGIATAFGVPALGNAIARVRAPDQVYGKEKPDPDAPYKVPGSAPQVPGQAPQVPGAAPAVPGADPLQEKAQAIGTVVSHLVKTGVPLAQAADATVAHFQQAEYQQKVNDAYVRARMANPFADPNDLMKGILGAGGVLSPEHAAEMERQKGVAQNQAFADKTPLVGQRANLEANQKVQGDTDARVQRRADINQNTFTKAENQSEGLKFGSMEGEAEGAEDPETGPVITSYKAGQAGAESTARAAGRINGEVDTDKTRAPDIRANAENKAAGTAAGQQKKGLTQSEYLNEYHRTLTGMAKDSKFTQLPHDQQVQAVQQDMASRGVTQPGQKKMGWAALLGGLRSQQ